MEVISQLNLNKFVSWALSLKRDDCRPTPKTKDSFQAWRKKSFESLSGAFCAWQEGGNPLPLHLTAGKFGRHLVESMTDKECMLVEAVVNAYFVKADFALAYLVGKLDFLQWLWNTHSAGSGGNAVVKTSPKRRTTAGNDRKYESLNSLSLRQIALLYWYNKDVIYHSTAKEILAHHVRNDERQLVRFYNSADETNERLGLNVPKSAAYRLRDLQTVLPHITLKEGKDLAKIEIDRIKSYLSEQEE